MNTIFIKTKNSGAKESHLFKSQLPGKIDLRTPPKDLSLSNLSIYFTRKISGSTKIE